MTWLLGIRSFLSSVPREVWYALGALLLVWGVYLHGKGVGYDQRTAEYEAAKAKAVERAREADGKAGEQRNKDTERNNDADQERKDAARTGGRDAVNCARLRRAYPNRSFPACD